MQQDKHEGVFRRRQRTECLDVFGFPVRRLDDGAAGRKKKKKAPSNKCNVGAAPREIKVRYKQKVENSRNAVEWARGQKVYIAQIDGTTHV